MRVDTLTYDMPREGLRYRAPISCSVNAAPDNCSEGRVVASAKHGITLSMGRTKPATAFYSTSIDKPD
jgi:hypothetical protein